MGLEKRVRIILQARTTSNRLPAKSLLPVGGTPLAILCALRLSSKGREVVLATSDEASDDLLVKYAEKYAINAFRGSLDNVLKRFIDCTKDLGDDDIIIRATADNPIPDGDFIEKLISYFKTSNSQYLSTGSPKTGLPYGVSAEIFRLGFLREGNNKKLDKSSQEHVTIYLKDKVGDNCIIPHGIFVKNDLSKYRATIDTLDDYLHMVELFDNIPCPEKINWKDLLNNMLAGDQSKIIEYNIIDGIKYGRITLGTAQLGSEYGITNFSGCPDDKEVCSIISSAVQGGITHFDTARAYGNSEKRLGALLFNGNSNKLKIITKLKPMAEIPKEAKAQEIYNAVDASVYGSCYDLRSSYIDVMMLHRYSDMINWEGKVLDRLSFHLKKGLVGEIGVSVYSPEEAIHCLEDKRITHIQIPFNLLDNRWLKEEFINQIKNREDMKIHARSIFLQGILLNDAYLWPKWFLRSKKTVERIDSLVKMFCRKNRMDLCMSYVKSFPWVTSLVVGVEKSEQIQEVLSYSLEPPLSYEECLNIQEVFNEIPERLINPYMW